MPKLRSETYGSGDTRWMATRHGMVNARTMTLDASKVGGEGQNKGIVLSGTPLAEVSGKVQPWDGSTGEFVGHCLFDQDARYGDVAVPVYWHGSVFADKVPGEFTAPTTQTKTSLVYL